MNKTPLLEFVYNRKKTAATNREAAVELRITFERKQKYMTTGIRLLPKHWHRGAVVNRIDTAPKLYTNITLFCLRKHQNYYIFAKTQAISTLLYGF